MDGAAPSVTGPRRPPSLGPGGALFSFAPFQGRCAAEFTTHDRASLRAGTGACGSSSSAAASQHRPPGRRLAPSHPEPVPGHRCASPSSPFPSSEATADTGLGDGGREGTTAPGGAAGDRSLNQGDTTGKGGQMAARGAVLGQPISPRRLCVSPNRRAEGGRQAAPGIGRVGMCKGPGVGG